jgi:hypothetical protein
MPLVLRATKGSLLSIAEMDGNLTYLDTRSSTFNILSFASGPGATITDVTFAAAIAAMPTAGGTLRLPASATYVLGATVQINKAIHLLGDGKAAMYRTHLGTNIQFGNFPAFRISAAGTHMSMMHGTGLSDPTLAGAASQFIVVDIQEPVTLGSTAYGNLPGSYSLDYLSCYNVLDGIAQLNGQEGQISYVDFQRFIRYGISLDNVLLEDGGDHTILGCNFYPETVNGVSGIFQRAGGGAKISSCKFNGRNGGGMLHGYQGSLVNSSVLNIENNSFENILGSAILASQVNLCSIIGNEFANYNGTPPEFINISNALGVNIGHNLFQRGVTTGPAMRLNNLTGLCIGTQSYNGWNNIVDAVIVSTCTFSLQYTAGGTATTTGAGPIPAETTFSDAFPAPTTTGLYRWIDSSAGAGLVTANGGLSLQPGRSINATPENSKAQYTSALAYNMAGRSLTFNVTSIANSADNGAASCFLSVGTKVRSSASNIALVVQGNVLYAQWGDAHATFGQAPYVAANMKYLRFAVSADGLNFTLAYSGDNAAFTTLLTLALGGVSMAAAYITLTTLQSSGGTLSSPTLISSATLA